MTDIMHAKRHTEKEARYVTIQYELYPSVSTWMKKLVSLHLSWQKNKATLYFDGFEHSVD